MSVLYFDPTILLSSLLIIILVWFLFGHIIRSYVKQFHRKLLAYVLSAFGKDYTKAMSIQKKKLFSELREPTLAQDSETGSLKDMPLNLVEIGAGAGTNFQYFPEGTCVTCVEPNEHFDGYFKKSIEEHGSHLVLLGQKVCCAEDMSVIESESVDVVVCTLVLCSVDDVPQSLREIYRILKKGGRFFFMEHIVAETGSWMYTFQKMMRGLNKCIAECDMMRPTHEHIHKAGFSKVKADIFQAHELIKDKNRLVATITRLFTRHLRGIATK